MAEKITKENLLKKKSVFRHFRGLVILSTIAIALTLVVFAFLCFFFEGFTSESFQFIGFVSLPLICCVLLTIFFKSKLTKIYIYSKPLFYLASVTTSSLAVILLCLFFLFVFVSLPFIGCEYDCSVDSGYYGNCCSIP